MQALRTILAFALACLGLSVAHVLRLYMIARARGLLDFPEGWRRD